MTSGVAAALVSQKSAHLILVFVGARHAETVETGSAAPSVDIRCQGRVQVGTPCAGVGVLIDQGLNLAAAA